MFRQIETKPKKKVISLFRLLSLFSRKENPTLVRVLLSFLYAETAIYALRKKTVVCLRVCVSVCNEEIVFCCSLS